VLAAGAGGEDGEALVAVPEAVAVRAGMRAGPPHLGEAGDVRDVVEHPRREDDGPRNVRAAIPGEADRAVEDLGVLDVGGDDIDAVAGELRPAAGAQVRGIQAVVAEDAVHFVGCVVARRTVVEHQDAPARAA
jgi:hypothetical protein